MPARPTTSKEFREFVAEWLASAFEDGLIDRVDRTGMLRDLPAHVRRLVADLNDSGRARLDLGGRELTFRLHAAQDPKLGRFNHFELQWSNSPAPRRLRCFVGHRFSPPITRTLRPNLRLVLEPLGVELRYSGKDPSARGFFDELLREIRECDFCIFDTREVGSRPNVYIEAGIAYALAKPTLLAEFTGDRVGLPADLHHVQTLRYADYRQLTRRLTFKLPTFLRESGLWGG